MFFAMCIVLHIVHTMDHDISTSLFIFTYLPHVDKLNSSFFLNKIYLFAFRLLSNFVVIRQVPYERIVVNAGDRLTFGLDDFLDVPLAVRELAVHAVVVCDDVLRPALRTLDYDSSFLVAFPADCLRNPCVAIVHRADE